MATKEHIILSPIDTAVRRVHVMYTFVYEKNDFTFTEHVENIKQAGIKLTAKYPFLTGTVETTSQGQVIQFARGDEMFIEIDENYPKTRNEVGYLDNYQLMTENLPNDLVVSSDTLKNIIFALKITKFRCDGICVGVSFHHKAFDGNGAAFIIQQLSKLINNEEISEIHSSNRNELFDQILSELKEESSENNEYISIPFDPKNPPCFKSERDTSLFRNYYFRISHDKLKTLQSEFNDKLEKEERNYKLSINDVVCGWYWNLMINVSNKKLEDEYSWKFFFVADFRNRIEEIPNGYVGNCALIQSVSLNNIKKQDINLIDLCCLIRKRVNEINSKSSSDVTNKILWLKNKQKTPHLFFPNWRPQTDAGIPDVMISSWFRFPFYDIKFTKETPRYAGVAQLEGMPGIGILQPVANSPDIALVTSVFSDTIDKMKDCQLYKDFVLSC